MQENVEKRNIKGGVTWMERGQLVTRGGARLERATGGDKLPCHVGIRQPGLDVGGQAYAQEMILRHMLIDLRY